jgi:hypothetical protein
MIDKRGLRLTQIKNVFGTPTRAKTLRNQIGVSVYWVLFIERVKVFGLCERNVFFNCPVTRTGVRWSRPYLGYHSVMGY